MEACSCHGIKKNCNTLEDSDKIVCGSMYVLDLGTKIKRFIEFYACVCVPAKLNLMMCGAPPRTIAVQFELASLLPECAGKTML